MKLGIVGLPNVGKSTLFNAITQAGAESANYPFCTIEPNVGTVIVPDDRLKYLKEMSHSAKATPTTVEFYDIAGLVKGSSHGEGLGNQFLSHIREVQAIVHVVRCFENPNVIHVDGSIDPARDIETIQLELMFSDLELLEKKLEKLERAVKGDKKLVFELEFVKKLMNSLEKGQPIRLLDLDEKEKKILKGYNLLSSKSVIYVANVSEDDIGTDLSDNPYYQSVKEVAKDEDAAVVVISAEIEEEIAQLDEDEKEEFLEELGIDKSGLDQLIQAGYHLLGLISFLTTGEQESRAWTVKAGTKAPAAAGKIHTDMERGFIRAETIAFDDLVKCGSMATARDKGLIRSEGKDYIVQDGDVILFRFNV